jgi:hypothetical protein
MSSAHDASAVLADLVACLAAIGRSMHDAFDPRGFLEEFSVSLLLTLLATPVYYSLFDDAAARFAPREWLGRLFGRRAPRAVTADGFRS